MEQKLILGTLMLSLSALNSIIYLTGNGFFINAFAAGTCCLMGVAILLS